MRIYILGIHGMLGSELFYNFLKNKNFVVRGSTKKKNLGIFKNYKSYIDLNLDLNSDNFAKVKKIFFTFKPDVIINCIGIVKQKIKKNYDLKNVLFVNSVLPHKINYISKLVNSKFLHFSTDCVFDGKVGNYKESSIPNARDIYGVSKYLGEIDNDKNACTIRTSIIGHERYNKKGLLEWLLSRKKNCYGFLYSYFSGVTTFEVYKFLINFFFKKNFSGLLHLHSSKISKYNLLFKIKKIYKLDVNIYKSKKLKINRSLKSSYLKNFFLYKSPTWDIMLKEMLNNKEV